MRNLLLLALLLVLIFTPSSPQTAAAPPTPLPPTFAEVKEWWGTYTIAIIVDDGQSVSDDHSSFNATMKYRRTCAGKFHLDHRDRSTMMTAEEGAAMAQEFLNPQTNPSNKPQEKPQNYFVWSGDFEDKKGNPRPTATGRDFVEYSSSSETVGEDTGGRGGGTMEWHGEAVCDTDVPVIRLIIDEKQKSYGVILPYLNFMWLAGRLSGTKYESTGKGQTNSWAVSNSDGKVSEKHGECAQLMVLFDLEAKTFTKKIPGYVSNLALPGKVSDLYGEIAFDVTAHRIGSFPSDLKDSKGHMTFTWNFSPKPPEEVELVLEPEDKGEYENWRPEAITEDEPGNNIAIRARLQKTDGTAPKDTGMLYVKFYLEDVTHEPGVCINYPKKPQSPSPPDLQIISELNPLFAVIDDHLSGSFTSDVPFKEKSVRVASYDWGAFGTLHARCRLDDGRVLYAKLKSNPGQDSIRIPKCKDGSKVADSYRHEVTDEDDSDNDNTPIGDGQTGDGFTFYEEYRGMCVDTDKGVEHFSMDPTRKNLFIYDKSHYARDVLAASHALKAATGLKVIAWNRPFTHEDRVINFNCSRTAHHVDQHAIFVYDGPDDRTYVQGGPGTPKNIEGIYVGPQNTAEDRGQLVRAMASACNIWPHGDGDEGWQRWMTRTDANGKKALYPTGLDETAGVVDGTSNVPIILYLETAPNTPWTPNFETTRVFVGNLHGSLSGEENCWMVPQISPVASRKGDQNSGTWQFYWATDYHLTGALLCAKADGHLYNADDAHPQPRFGSADIFAKRGDCLKQILVNDGAKPQARYTKH